MSPFLSFSKKALFVLVGLYMLGTVPVALADLPPWPEQEDPFTIIPEGNTSIGSVVSLMEALVLTLILEVPLLFLFVRKVLRIASGELSSRRLLFTGIAASCITLPFLWFVLPNFLASYPVFLLTGETVVWLVEACLFAVLLRLKWGKALLASLLCNLSSFAIGFVIQSAWK